MSGRGRLRTPHLAVSAVRWVDVPARHGVAAHRDALRRTACGQEKDSALTTVTAQLVRCPDCLAALALDKED